jgi:hypothetical protein
MNNHPYLRAYLAGIAVPTPMMLCGLTAYVIARYVFNVPIPIERAVAFPLVLVPNGWGLWNVVYLALHDRWHLPIGAHGALLPLLLIPGGYCLAKLLGIDFIAHDASWMWVAFPMALTIYYLAWKYLVNFCNHLLGVA